MRKRFNYLMIVFLIYILSALSYFVDKGLAVLSLVILTPIILCVLSIDYSKRYKIDSVLFIGVGVLFLPFIIYPYNSSALIYCVIYAIASLIGQFIGYFLFNSKP